MNQKLAVLALLAGTTFAACTNQVPEQKALAQPPLEPGAYRFALQIHNYELPFTAQLDYGQGGDSPTLTIENAGEKILVDRLRITDDSLIADLPVFQSALLCRIESPELLSGAFVNYTKTPPSSIPFMAEHAKDFRFTSSKSAKVLPKRYKVLFHEGVDNTFPAVLLLENSEGQLNATFLTEAGDFRFLEGNIMNERIYLSAFDGSHAFYFEAKINGDSLREGIFRSGPTYEAQWEAIANSIYTLTDPEKLTFMIDGKGPIALPFPNQDGDTLGWVGLGLENKVVVIDIFGSWCPNCMDASLALHQISLNYTENDLAIVPVAFEYTDDLDLARKRVFKMQRDLNIPQHFLFGGRASKKNAASRFPMLNNISSFPTIIVVDKNRNVRSVYTGFYGPGTGTYYQDFITSTDSLLGALIAED